jgi:hypothetical protein
MNLVLLGKALVTIQLLEINNLKHRIQNQVSSYVNFIGCSDEKGTSGMYLPDDSGCIDPVELSALPAFYRLPLPSRSEQNSHIYLQQL